MRRIFSNRRGDPAAADRGREPVDADEQVQAEEQLDAPARVAGEDPVAQEPLDAREPLDGQEPSSDRERIAAQGHSSATHAPEVQASTDIDDPRREESEAGDQSRAEEQLEAGLEPSRRGFVSRVRSILGRGSDDDAWEEVEATLIGADLGAELTLGVVKRARARRDLPPELALRHEMVALFAMRDPVPWPRKPGPDIPAVVLVVGVNGTGKTTTIAKLAHRFSARGARVLLAAGDTFRAAAIDQLQIWGARTDVPVIAHRPGADPSAVVYDALDAAAARGSDVVLIDTAGRLHTKSNLMDELAKIRRTIAKRLPEAQPEVLFVLDATTGQNGLAQAKAFNEASPLTGIALTKLDSTAKGGVAFAIEKTLGVPVLFVGVGEKMDDLLDFHPNEFVEALFG